MLCAFDSILNMLKPIQKRESGITADVLISLIDQMKLNAFGIRFHVQKVAACSKDRSRSYGKCTAIID